MELYPIFSNRMASDLLVAPLGGGMIENIDQAAWFQTLDHCPRTVNDLKLLISVVDKINIFDKFDLTSVARMKANKLNVLYAVLRMMNKVYNCYCDYAVKKIFINNLKDLFPCSNLTWYDLFFDQLTQDIYHFVCQTIRQHYPQLDAALIKKEFVAYLKSTFMSETFYEDIMEKMEYTTGPEFFSQNDNLFTEIVQEFVNSTKETLTETYDTMKIFLNKIFCPQCSNSTVQEIIESLEKNIDLDSLFKESCLEIDIYVEQKLDAAL